MVFSLWFKFAFPCGVWINKEEQEDPELTSSHRHTNITTTYRATISENDLKTSRNDFSQLKTQRRNHNKMGMRGADVFQPGTTPQCSNPQGGGKSQPWKSSPRSKESDPHILLPSPGDLHQEDEPSKHLALKTSRTYVQEGQRLQETKTLLLNGMHKNSLTLSHSEEIAV